MRFRYYLNGRRVEIEDLQSRLARNIPFTQTIKAVCTRLKSQGIITD